MTVDTSSDPGSESPDRNLWQRFGKWIPEHSAADALIIGILGVLGIVTGLVLRECLDAQYSAKVPLIVGLISYFVTIYSLGVINIFQPDISKHYSVAAQAVCAFITAYSLGLTAVVLFWPSPPQTC